MEGLSTSHAEMIAAIKGDIESFKKVPEAEFLNEDFALHVACHIAHNKEYFLELLPYLNHNQELLKKAIGHNPGAVIWIENASPDLQKHAEEAMMLNLMINFRRMPLFDP